MRRKPFALMDGWRIEIGDIWKLPSGKVARVVAITGTYFSLVYDDGEGVTLTKEFLTKRCKYVGSIGAVQTNKP